MIISYEILNRIFLFFLHDILRSNPSSSLTAPQSSLFELLALRGINCFELMISGVCLWSKKVCILFIVVVLLSILFVRLLESEKISWRFLIIYLIMNVRIPIRTLSTYSLAVNILLVYRLGQKLVIISV